jgi:hypothetical protein
MRHSSYHELARISLKLLGEVRMLKCRSSKVSANTRCTRREKSTYYPNGQVSSEDILPHDKLQQDPEAAWSNPRGTARRSWSARYGVRRGHSGTSHDAMRGSRGAAREYGAMGHPRPSRASQGDRVTQRPICPEVSSWWYTCGTEVRHRRLSRVLSVYRGAELVAR